MSALTVALYVVVLIHPARSGGTQISTSGIAGERPTAAPGVARNRVNVALGERLRSLRQRLGLSLSDVESRSRGALSAVALGSYERGDRTVSVVRLGELATFYGVLPEDLVADLHRPSSLAARLGEQLRALSIGCQIQEWHDLDSGARGLQIRLSCHAGAALLGALAAVPSAPHENGEEQA